MKTQFPMHNHSPYLFPGLKGVITSPPTMDDIVTVVCEEMGLPRENVFLKRRLRPIVECRQMCMYFIKMMLSNETLKTIGDHFGGLDHTTVIHSIKTTEGLLETDKRIWQCAWRIKGRMSRYAASVYIGKEPEVYVLGRRKKIIQPKPKPFVRPESKYNNSGHIQVANKYLTDK